MERGLGLPHRGALQLDAVGVVEETVADGVGLVGIADDAMPVRDGELAGDERGSPFAAFLDDLDQVAALTIA